MALTSLLLSGCSTEKENAESNAEAQPVQIATLQSLYPLPPKTTISGITAAENVCMVAGEADNAIYVAVMPHSTEAGGVTFSETFSFKYDKLNHVYGVAASDDGFYLLAGNRGEEYTEEAAQLTVLTISYSGQLQSEAPLG